MCMNNLCMEDCMCNTFFFQTPEDSAERGSCPICTRLLGTEIIEVRVVIVCIPYVFGVCVLLPYQDTSVLVGAWMM